MLSAAEDSDGLVSQLARGACDWFGDRWQVNLAQRQLTLRPRLSLRGSPPHSAPTPRQVVDTIALVFGRNGVNTAALLPIRWGRDTDLTISAIQGLDPWLKDGVDRVWREGFLPQPVVRFTGERDSYGRLREGFLTSFVNLSCVQRITSVGDHLRLIDTWISALSAIGIHARRLMIHGDLNVWHRGTVSGITLFVSCDGVTFADAVLLWHTAKPENMATDIGSGLERLRWLLSSRSWAETVFGHAADWWTVDLLDALRSATLLVMAGIRPASSGAGSSLRRVLRPVPPTMAAAGLGRVVRAQRAYWADIGMAGPSWPHISTVIEDEILMSARGQLRTAACRRR